MDWNKKIAVTNKSGTIVLAGILEIPHGAEDFLVDPSRHPESTIKALQLFEQRGTITVTNNYKETPEKIKDSYLVKKVQTVSSEHGDTHDHYVFDPFKEDSKVISVKEINLSNGNLHTEEIDTNSKGIVVSEQNAVADDKMTREEAIDLINSQWKKFESEVNKITDVRKLNFLQVIAMEIGASDKKQKIIEDRLSSL
jgi:hypothetical protein